MNVRNILILSASFGDGHEQVSRALQRKFLEKGAERVSIVDLFAEAHPWINAASRYVYLKSYTVAPAVYGWCYYGTQFIRAGSRLSKPLHACPEKIVRSLLDKERPDVVVHTFPYMPLAEYRLQTNVPIPMYAVLTDFALHPRWLHPAIDGYYVATEALKATMLAAGAPDERIHVTGIPVREKFEKSGDRQEMYRKYGLNPAKKTVLMMAGAYGVTRNLPVLCRELLGDEAIEIVLVCGKNIALQKELAEEFAAYPQVRVLGFVEEIDEWMRVASCVVTKAGGVTLAEAIASALPVILYRPVPGQERENARFLASQGAAVIVTEAEAMAQEIRRLLADDGRLAAMQRAMKKLHLPHAAERIVDSMIADASQRANAGSMQPANVAGGWQMC